MRLSLALSVALLSACGASPSPTASPELMSPAPGPAGQTPSTTASTEAPDPSALDASAPPSNAMATSAATPDEPTHCPDGMVLVEGDYCTEVEHTCVDEWFDKSNKKKVCEAFKPEAKCVGSKVKKRFCIDKYSWPNEKGVRPEVMNNFFQAQVKCAAVGKRMCTESEWTLSCEGPQMKPFPHGYRRDPLKCNGDHPWDGPNMTKVRKRDAKELGRLWRGVPSGTQPECVSDYGVADLPGNNDEVVSSEQFGDGWKGEFDSVHSGGPWYRGVRNQCRPKIYTHDEGFYYYFLGFRCCGEPDGQPTDPRTPKQVKKDTKFNFVERMARFTVAEMKEKLELKKQGKCDCADSKILCKTMCGTLVGPNAKDATKDDPRVQDRP